MSSVGPLHSVRARAPGKINVYLGVGALLDDGYHEVATVYQAVSLFETVHATVAPDFSVTFSGTIDTQALPTDGSNLAIRAARLLARVTGYRGGVALHIEKNVPIAGGMGGGSADAAATLVACDALWQTQLPREEIASLGAELGADVPFALCGGTAVGTGTGAHLSPALGKEKFDWVLAFASFGMSTPAVYHELDRHRERHAPDIFPARTLPEVDAVVLQALRAGDPHLLADVIHNDLQAPALMLQPSLTEVLQLGESSGALAGMVSGSGPTIAFLAADSDSAAELVSTLRASHIPATHTTGPVSGARLLD